MEGDPDWYDAKIAGWWVWGMACWIGAGFCSGKGPWRVVNGELVAGSPDGQGVQRRLVHLGDAGRGVQRQRVHLGNTGMGVQRRRLNLQGAGRGKNGLLAWMQALADRLRRVRVACGDWTRVCGPSPLVRQGLTGVFFDPPYGGEVGRTPQIYTHDDLAVAATVCAWCLANGAHPSLRIVLSGYATEHDVLLAQGWQKHGWVAHGGYENQGQGRGRANRKKEMLWYNPQCLVPAQTSLFP